MKAFAALSPALQVWVTRFGMVVPRLDAPPELLFDRDRPYFDPATRYVHVDLYDLLFLEDLSKQAPVSIDAFVDGFVAERLREAERDRRHALLAQLDEAGLIRHEHLVEEREELMPIEIDDGSYEDGDPGGVWVCRPPIAFPLGRAGFVHFVSESKTVHIPPHLIAMLQQFVTATTVDDLVAKDDAIVSSRSRHEIELSVRHLVSLGLLSRPEETSQEELRRAVARRFRAFASSDAAVVDLVERERVKGRDVGGKLVVVPVDLYEIPMLSLGMVVAAAQAFDNGTLNTRCAFAPLWYTKVDRAEHVLRRFGDVPAVFLFSHYTWTSNENLEVSKLVKRVVPNAITVHGGPNVPKYGSDVEDWFRQHPHVDVAVHGEGEITLAELLRALSADDRRARVRLPDLSALADVPGLTFRRGDGTHRTADRERIVDLDTLPSPYLAGLFEHRERWGWPAVNLETNRGCPYGCTFCDWGSATLSRVRKFSIDRVLAEMEWAARHEFSVFSLADANFGILERDIEIASYVVELKRRYSYPTSFHVNYAKNRVGNLAQIVQVLAGAGILTEGLVAVQTFDPGVLKTIRRSNIKQERYDLLANQFRQHGLPLYTDVMVGLPGSTVDTVRGDFQAAIDRELHVKAHPTQLLVNSPMNDPAYRREHGIVAGPSEHLEQAASYSHADWLEMMALRRFLYLVERRGLLRQVATYVRAETLVPELEFYDLIRRAGTDRARWPHLAYLVAVVPDEYVPPGSWRPTFEEIRRLCVTQLDVADDTALRTVLEVQVALLPTKGRVFPHVMQLDHDYADWHQSVMKAKRERCDGTWPGTVSPLRELGPGSLKIEDVDTCCERVIGQNCQGIIGEVIWELDSPVSRPKQLH